MNFSHFKPIPEFEDYLISRRSKIWSKKSNKFLNPLSNINIKGYLRVRLYNEEYPKGKYFFIHRICASVYCANPDPEKKVEVDHLRRDKWDNRAKYLRWVTPQENKQNMKRNFFKKKVSGPTADCPF